ncbi:MAG: type II toxin-antitoxin system VapC family toxin [Spiribacter salinus]|uniref:Type II toxin-antitoxin system VapC family toxin n=1 Tax=Spiribacter salinus TaxID=1335746 RepID=A0A540VF04_9GAMM|nr:MAG: type II toxin-antitoxin system VapC family toxin [Spiribacter salinus]
MTVGLDTSVVLRLLVGRPQDQAQRAKAAVDQALAQGPVHLCDLVIAEAYHALVYHYDVPKNGARSLLMRMMASGAFACSPRDMLDSTHNVKGCGLVDHLIMSRYRSLDATTLTFDRKMGAAGARMVD